MFTVEVDQLRQDCVERSQDVDVFMVIGGSALTTAAVVFVAHDVILTEVGVGLNFDETHWCQSVVFATMCLLDADFNTPTRR